MQKCNFGFRPYKPWAEHTPLDKSIFALLNWITFVVIIGVEHIVGYIQAYKMQKLFLRLNQWRQRHRKLLCHPAVTNELCSALRAVWSMKPVHMFSPFSWISNLLLIPLSSSPLVLNTVRCILYQSEKEKFYTRLFKHSLIRVKLLP